MKPSISFALAVLLSTASASAELHVGLPLVNQMLTCPHRVATGIPQARVDYFSPKTGRDFSIRSKASLSAPWNTKQVNSLIRTGFSTSKPTIVYVHGFMETSHSDWLNELRDKYSQMAPNFNLMFLDYSQCSHGSYYNAVANTPKIGKVLGALFDHLRAVFDYSPEMVHIVGFSLGTHVAGNAAREVTRRSSGEAQVGQVTAIDPTGVCFHEPDNNQFGDVHGLQPSDAKLVVARHYELFGLGAKRAIGDLDIYVNGGGVAGESIPTMSRLLERGGFRARQAAANVVGVLALGKNHIMGSYHETKADNGPRDCYGVAYTCKDYQTFLTGACAGCGADGSDCYQIDNFDALGPDGQPVTRASYKPGQEMHITAGLDGACLHHYQVKVELKKNAPRSARDSLKAGRTQFQVGRVNLSARNGLSRNVYTALSTSRTKMTLPASVNVIDSFGEAAQHIDQLHINYMSNPIEDERNKRSATYCGTRGTQLVRC